MLNPISTMAKQKATTLRIAKAMKNWGGTTPGMNNIPIVNRNNGTRIAKVRNDINQSEGLPITLKTSVHAGKMRTILCNVRPGGSMSRGYPQRLYLYLEPNTDVENTKMEMLERLLSTFCITRHSHCVAGNPIATSNRRSVAYRTYAILPINLWNRGARTP